jgi:glycosyltransferase involved in cell wall biosynthesis
MVLMKPCVWLIVFNWNGIHNLNACLGSLLSVDYPNHKMLLIDNNSQDDSVFIMKEYYAAVQIIAYSKNVGFTEGRNVDIRHIWRTAHDSSL